MIYCSPCREAKGWPESFIKSDRTCERCGRSALCSEVATGSLPNYEVRDVEVEESLKVFAREIKYRMPKNMGFSLLMFNYGEGGALFYISSAERKDMIETMKEFIRKNENNQ